MRDMLIDFAPMEGVTAAPYRRLHSKYFGGVDRYYAPFISPTADRRFTPKELRDILPENNGGIRLVPQLLTKNAGDFLWAAGELKAMGYDTVNLNVGCPSGTVTAKGKGAGMLAFPEALDAFLGEIFENAPCKISVKTRLGMNEPEEFWAILDIFNRYPIDELIIHPRVRRDFYREKVRTEYFAEAVARAKMPLGFNGGIVTAADCRERMDEFPSAVAIMLGQGLAADPFLAARVKAMPLGGVKAIREFHDELFEAYAKDFQSRNNAMQRMKELWTYLILSFAHGEKAAKGIKKAKNAEEYLSAANALFSDCPLREQAAAVPAAAEGNM